MDSIILPAIILCQIHVQAVENILDDQTINSEQVHVHVVVSLIFTNYCNFKIGAVVILVDSIILAIVLCQIYVQAVEYILDDQTINSEQVCGSIINLH